MAITTQTGIRQVTKSFANDDLFKGIIRLDDEHIGQYTPYVGGYGCFFWVKGPAFVERSDLEMWTRYKHYTEKGSTSFEGIQDISLETGGVQGGIAGNEFQVATNAKFDFSSFTIKVHELQGSMIREITDFWVTGIRDPKSGYAHYHGRVAEGMEYSAKNHTAELIYIATDPTGLHVEFATYIVNIIPTKVPKGSHLNLTHGDHGIAQFDLEYTGVPYEGHRINAVAQQIIDAASGIFNLDYYETNINATRVISGAAVDSNRSNL